MIIIMIAESSLMIILPQNAKCEISADKRQGKPGEQGDQVGQKDCRDSPVVVAGYQWIIIMLLRI